MGQAKIMRTHIDTDYTHAQTHTHTHTHRYIHKHVRELLPTGALSWMARTLSLSITLPPP